MKKERESFSSRLGFIMLSAGCAIGIGNVWRFPYVVGNNGGGAFVLFYVFFLAIMGIPILTMEFAMGRASGKSVVKAYQRLEKKNTKWRIHGIAAMIGNYVLMMFYTVVAGWMLSYFYQFLTGKMEGVSQEAAGLAFGEMLQSPKTMIFWMAVIVISGFLVCSLGLRNGVERISKWMMVTLLLIMAALAINSFTLEGGKEGLSFYLIPDFQKVAEIGLWNVIVSAMNQAFFTLSLGIGAMLIFGSYLNKEHTLLSEAITVGVLDTFVAFVSGLIIFPACFSFGINPDSGPGLIFITLPNVFSKMAGGRVVGTLFFLFMSFASFSTIIAVFENILSCCMDLFHISRKKASAINTILLILLSLPCVFGYNVWSAFQPLGAASSVLDLEDFIVSSVLLPLGSLIFLLFCTSRYGWGFENFRKEANEGKGLKLPKGIRFYLSYILPIMVLFLFLQGIWGLFKR